ITQVRTLPQGTSELFLHPSSAPGERLRARRWEARLLRDPLWHEALAQEVDELVAGWHPRARAPSRSVWDWRTSSSSRGAPCPSRSPPARTVWRPACAPTAGRPRWTWAARARRAGGAGPVGPVTTS